MGIISDLLARRAKHTADYVQTQLNEAIASGDQLAETQQARVDAGGYAFQNLKARLDKSDANLAAQQAENVQKFSQVDANILDLQTEINTLATNKAEQTDLLVERARIDSFTALEAGATTGDAELIDARVGVDGVTYPNAGGAIRGQINALKSDLTNTFVELNTSYRVIQKHENAYIPYASNLQPFSEHLNINSYYIEVAKGDTYKISGTSLAESAGIHYRAYQLYGMDNETVESQPLDVWDSMETIKDKILVCPVDGYLIVQGDTTVQEPLVSILLSSNYMDSLSNHNTFAFTRNGYYKRNDGVAVALADYSFIQCSFNPDEVNYFKISGYDWHSVYYGYMFMGASWNIVSQCDVINGKFETVVKAPVGASILIVNGNNDGGNNAFPTLVRSPYPLQVDSVLNAKTGVFFGTSIPEGQVNGKSYPSIMAEKLGMTLYNEAKGSSRARDDNTRYFPLSLTVAEIRSKDWYATLSDGEKAEVEACSFENKLDKYLTAFSGSVGDVDVYFFEHGYNDRSSNHAELITVPTDPVDRTTYIGAMNFLIKRILSNNPNAKIVIVSHYENTGDDETDFAAGYYTCKAQEYVANQWGIYYARLYERLNMSPTTGIYTPYAWANGVWTSTPGTYLTINNKNRRCADKIHPHTDLSGGTIQMMGDKLAEIIRPLVF